MMAEARVDPKDKERKNQGRKYIDGVREVRKFADEIREKEVENPAEERPDNCNGECAPKTSHRFLSEYKEKKESDCEADHNIDECDCEVITKHDKYASKSSSLKFHDAKNGIAIKPR